MASGLETEIMRNKLLSGVRSVYFRGQLLKLKTVGLTRKNAVFYGKFIVSAFYPLVSGFGYSYLALVCIYSQGFVFSCSAVN